MAQAGLAHLHRLRALVDAVVIGVGTAIADDPQLTVRRVEGPSPARVIIDPNGRLPSTARVLAADGIRRLVIAKAGTPAKLPAGVEIVPLPADQGRLAPAAIIAALADRGFRRILIEGGADTVSRFLAARCLDRLHVLVAPIILGAGNRASRCRRSSGSTRPCGRRCAPIFLTRTCCSTAISALSALPIGRAKMST